MVASNDRNRRRFNQRGNNRRQDDDRNQVSFSFSL